MLIRLEPYCVAGEILEFKQDLNAMDRSKKKDAVKKVIAAMTVGKDVSSLFPGGHGYGAANWLNWV